MATLYTVQCINIILYIELISGIVYVLYTRRKYKWSVTRRKYKWSVIPRKYKWSAAGKGGKSGGTNHGYSKDKTMVGHLSSTRVKSVEVLIKVVKLSGHFG